MVKRVQRSNPTSGPSKASSVGPPLRRTLRDALLELLDPDERTELIGLKGEALGLYQFGSSKKRRYLALCEKAWALLLTRLSSGESICTGCDPRDPFISHRAIPASRWAYAKMDYERWTAKIGEVEVIEIEISTVGGLHIHKSLRQARLGTVTFRLGASIFLFVTLAEGAKSGRPFESVEELKQKHFSTSQDPKVVGQAIFKIRQRMVRAGIEKETIEALVINEVGGYRLNMPSAEITIED